MRILQAAAFVLLASISIAAQSDAAKSIEGTWIYAKDPAGKIKMDPIYDGSTITFEAGGKYAFKLGDFGKPLAGTWELRDAKGDTIKVHTEYGQGRRNDLTLLLRRDAKQVVIGFEIREGEDATGARYYALKK